MYSRAALSVVMLAMLCLPAQARVVLLGVPDLAELQNQPMLDGFWGCRVVRAAFAAAGHEVRFEALPWKRAQRLWETCRIDGVFPAAFTPHRSDYACFSEAVGQARLGFFRLKEGGAAFDGSLESLRGYSIGTIAGAQYPPAFQAAAFLETEPGKNIRQNLGKLLKNRVDMVLDYYYPGAFLLQTEFAAQAHRVEFLPIPLADITFYVMLSKCVPEAAELTADFNRGLALIRSDGTYQAILQKRGY